VRRLAARGVTLMEMMAVIVIIGILAAVASPSFVMMFRDQRVSRAALEVSDIYRLARSRAMGRGSAVLVRFNGSGGVAGNGLFEVREAIQPTAGVPLPATSCLATNWTNGDPANRPVSRFDPGASYELAQLAFQDDVPSTQTFSEICFTPRGRTFTRSAPAGIFTPLLGVPSFTVTNTRTGRVRTVFIPPTGAARVAL
jgi:prepilin-type N-terminal cleavage/methylation domain-containing protein